MTAIVLVQPEIPGNTGAVGRTCVALDMELVLIHPLGFEISDKRVKRSGLDYWPHIRLVEFASWDDFLAERTPRADQLYLFEEYATRSFYEPDYPEDAYLVFGRETKGIPEAIVMNLMPVIEKINVLLLASLLPLFGMLIFWGALLSHRFCGPLERVEKGLDRILKGNYSIRFRVRKNDDIQGIVEKLNRILDILQSKKGGSR